jgi:TolA-binding protein
MSRPVKIILYVVCLTVGVVFGLKAKQEFRKASASKQVRQLRLDEASNVVNTNLVAERTNILAENTGAAVDTNAVPAEPAANTETNQTNVAAAGAPVKPGGTPPAPSFSYSKMISYLLLCAAGFVGLAFLVARDIAHFFALKAEQAMFNDDGVPADPEYEQAEELWKDGRYLEAIQGMREYLQKHPREQYVALRIAEIYETNLSNPLAAALEYEEVLKKNLPPERWGWAAIHLANIYSGALNQPEKAVALLHRIDAEYGTTSAANKARERLIQIDPTFVPAAAAAVPAAAAESEAPAPSNLPPGFRPKTKV